MVPSNENELILQALTQSSPPSKKRYEAEMFLDDLIESPQDDPIWKLAKKEERKEKARKKTIEEWSGADFLRYLNDRLTNYGLKLERAGIRDRDCVSKLFDDFVRCLGKKMTNEILREYFDWWISVNASNLHGEKIYIYRLMGRFDIEKFITRYEERSKVQTPIIPKINVSQPTPDDMMIYEVSGLPAVLMKKGIVVGHRILKEKKTDNAFQLIIKTLQSFSKETLGKTMDVTLAGAPYPQSDTVDFLSLARHALQFHKIVKYLKLDYKSYFKS